MAGASGSRRLTKHLFQSNQCRLPLVSIEYSAIPSEIWKPEPATAKPRTSHHIADFNDTESFENVLSRSTLQNVSCRGIVISWYNGGNGSTSTRQKTGACTITIKLRLNGEAVERSKGRLEASPRLFHTHNNSIVFQEYSFLFLSSWVRIWFYNRLRARRSYVRKLQKNIYV